jgi:phage baseplate assembly protein W
MSTLADQLSTTYFQLSAVGVGALAVGIEDIRQRISNVLNTIPGTDPFRPLFGCLAYTFTDKPVDIAIPNIKKEIFESLSLWMPEIQVNGIFHELNGISQLDFTITYSLIDTDLIDSVLYSVGETITGNNTSNSIIITALVPAPVANGIYRPLFLVDGKAVNPQIPEYGFGSADAMLGWINANWANYGRWYLTGSSLILYLNSGVATTASLTVTEATALTISVLIPELVQGNFYHIALTGNGIAIAPQFPTASINTLESLLNWVRSNWGAYGIWNIQSTYAPSEAGDFDSDLTNDFNNGAVRVDSYLVFQTESFTTATLTIN